MDQKSHAMLQRLIIELDDTCNLYSAMGRMLISPHAKDVVERIVLAHAAIAEDLVEHMLLMGAHKVRRGSMLGKLYARCGAWWTMAGADLELSCLLHIERREAWIVQRFCAAAEHALGLQQRLHRHLGELQYVFAQLVCTLDGVDALAHQVALLAAGTGRSHPALDTSKVFSQQLADELPQRHELGKQTDRPAGGYGAQSADAIREVADTRPRMNRRAPLSETLSLPREYYAECETRFAARVQPVPQAFSPIMAHTDTRPSSLPRPARQRADPEADALRPWDRPGKFYEHMRRRDPLRAATASAPFTPALVERFAADKKRISTVARRVGGVNEVGSSGLESSA